MNNPKENKKILLKINKSFSKIGLNNILNFTSQQKELLIPKFTTFTNVN